MILLSRILISRVLPRSITSLQRVLIISGLSASIFAQPLYRLLATVLHVVTSGTTRAISGSVFDLMQQAYNLRVPNRTWRFLLVLGLVRRLAILGFRGIITIPLLLIGFKWLTGTFGSINQLLLINEAFGPLILPWIEMVLKILKSINDLDLPGVPIPTSWFWGLLAAPVTVILAVWGWTSRWSLITILAWPFSALIGVVTSILIKIKMFTSVIAWPFLYSWGYVGGYFSWCPSIPGFNAVIHWLAMWSGITLGSVWRTACYFYEVFITHFGG